MEEPFNKPFRSQTLVVMLFVFVLEGLIRFSSQASWETNDLLWAGVCLSVCGYIQNGHFLNMLGESNSWHANLPRQGDGKTQTDRKSVV